MSRSDIELTVGVCAGAPSSESKARPVLCEMARCFSNLVRRNTDGVLDVFGSETDQRSSRNLVEKARNLARSSQSLFDDHEGDAHCEMPFVTRDHREPKVRVGGRHRHSRLGMDQVATLVLRSELAETDRVANRRLPSAEPVCTDRQNRVRVCDVVVRRIFLVINEPDGVLHHSMFGRVVLDVTSPV